MNHIRRLQYIGNQFLVNVPVETVKINNWHKGDYLSMKPMGNNKVEITKIADGTTPRTDAMLNALIEEANTLNWWISEKGASMEPHEFSWQTGHLAHLHAKIRKLRQQLESGK